jgi:hypothetical protein
MSAIERDALNAARGNLSYKDWLFDGSPIRSRESIERFEALDWDAAWIDLGPSPTGNLGPYWHVPMKDGETTHRLYPKALLGKWGPLMRQACLDYLQWALSHPHDHPFSKSGKYARQAPEALS